MKSNQSGFAHLGLLAIMILVLGGIGLAGYSVYQKNQDKETAATASKDQQDGEILPPSDTQLEEPADITDDDLTEPTQ